MPAAAGAAPQIASRLNAPKPASGVIAPKPIKVDGAPQIASGLNAPKPASGVIAAKPTKVDGAPVLDSTVLVEASRNLSKKLKELSAASSTHIKTPTDVKPKKVKNIAKISFFFCY